MEATETTEQRQTPVPAAGGRQRRTQQRQLPLASDEDRRGLRGLPLQVPWHARSSEL